jgi:CRISPR/Cas system-associated exonuclease Cas4 (RecB family)
LRPEAKESIIAATPRSFPLVESASAELRLRAARDFLTRLPPMTEALLVGASRGSVDDLARTVAAGRERGVAAGLHRFSFTQLAARLAAVALAERGLTPGTLLGTEAVAARAAFEARSDRTLDYFGPVAGCPGFPRALARTLLEVRMAGLDAGRLAALPLGGSDLADLFERFEEQFAAASASDRAALFQTAADRLRAGRTPWSGHPLVLLDLPIESSVEREFVAALIESATDVLATIPSGDRVSLDAFRALGGAGAAIEEEGTSDLVALRRRLFAAAPPEPREPTGELTFFSAPGEAREACEIARRIITEAQRGVRFDEMAIFVRSPKDYLGLLEHALRRARPQSQMQPRIDGDQRRYEDEGIPAYFDRGTRRPHPSGRAFLAILACAAEKLSARRFAEYLSLGQVPQLDSSTANRAREAELIFAADEELTIGPASERPESDEDEPGVSIERLRPERAAGADDAVVEGTLRAPWKWEYLIVESSVIGGDADRWRRRLDGLARTYRHQIRELRKEEPESPRVRRLERDLLNLGHLRQFALPIVTRLAGWPHSATWGEWLGHFDEIAPLVLRKPARVERVLAGLRPMAAIGPIALAEARAVLADRLLSLEIDPPARRYGRVFVGSPHQARGRAFRVVFVPGLAERMFPQKPREDPMLLDDERVTLGGLAVQEDRDTTERLLLRLAIGAATERLHLSYPRLEIAEGRPRVPSFYALDVMRAVTGRIPSHEDLERAAYEEGGARLAWPSPADPARALDDVEHDLAVLRSLLDEPIAQKVRGHAHYILRLNDNLKRAVTTRWKRAQSTWSPYDGVVRVTGQTRAALAAERLGTRPYSLSALQKFANCPYQFLLSAMYRLEQAEEPEPLQQLDPLLRGSIFHAIQAEFFRALERDNFLEPSRTPSNPLEPSRTFSNLLEQTIERVSNQYREELVPAIERVWEAEIAEIAKDLRVWAARMPDKDGWRPHRFEFSFGLSDEGRDPRSLPDPVRVDGRFLLRGSIDLLEERRGGQELRVTDHKTGKARVTDKAIVDGGRALQPVLYGLAMETALELPVVSGRLYYCTSAGGFTEREIPLNERTRRAGLDVLEIVDRAIELGFLPPAPAARACSWCDFRPICGPHEEKRLRNKSADRLGDVIALREMP